MKLGFGLLALTITHSAFSQKPAQNNLADSGKNEFKMQAIAEIPNYTKAYRILSGQVSIQPQNTELLYFLGYTIYRLNGGNGLQLNTVQKELSIKASAQFEAINKIEPLYKGEIFELDPYSMITAIWGSLAASYRDRKLPDSVHWAFLEGKRRGGFSETALEYDRQLLNSCRKRSVLITAGDNISFPCWYLQEIEQYRRDISIVDINLLNTAWYPKYLRNQQQFSFSLSDNQIDTAPFLKWQTSILHIENPFDSTQYIRWPVRPTINQAYISRGDRLLLDIIHYNIFQKDIYFSSTVDSSKTIGLYHYLVNDGIVNKVPIDGKELQRPKEKISKNLARYSIDRMNTINFSKSIDLVTLVNGFRWSYIQNIKYLVSSGMIENARILRDNMNKKFPVNLLPYSSAALQSETENYLQTILKTGSDK